MNESIIAHRYAVALLKYAAENSNGDIDYVVIGIIIDIRGCAHKSKQFTHGQDT